VSEGDRRLVRSSAVIGLGTALSRVTGFLRVSALAALGFGRLTDVYNVANSTPNILYELLLGGILTATLVPLYVEHHQRGDRTAGDAINTLVLVALAAVTVIGVVGAPWIVDVYLLRARGPDLAVQRALATDLLRWFMPQVFFYGVTTLATAQLNARHRFAAAAFAPALNNVVAIAVLLALPRLADGDLGVQRVADDPVLVALLGAGTTAGIAAMALVLLPALRRAGVSFRWRFELRHPAVRRLLSLSGWSVGYVVANQIAFWVVLVLAYRGEGDPSVYLAAFTFFQLPHGLFAVSIMTAVAPELADAAARGDRERLRDRFAQGLRLMLCAVMPSTVVLVVLARPIVNALLGYGAFSSRDAALTSQTLGAFAVGLVCFSLYLYTLRAFYAEQDTRTPFLINAGENAMNVALALVLYPVLGVRGLAWAWTAAYVVASVVALITLRSRWRRLEGRETLRTARRLALACGALAVVAWGTARLLTYATPTRALVATAAALVLGGAAFLASGRALRVGELSLIVRGLARRPAASPGV